MVCTVNTEMVRAYWLIGQAIVKQEQKGKGRADYGEWLIESLGERLTKELGKGFTRNKLWYMGQFYLTYPENSAHCVENCHGRTTVCCSRAIFNCI